MSAQFNGLGNNANGAISVPNSLDLEYELIRSRNLSFLFRTIIAFDLKTGVLPYAYTGVGARYYLWSDSRGYDHAQEGIQIKKSPTFRIYLGPELGLSQVVIKQYTPVVQTTSALLEAGGNLGLIYQLSSVIGLETQVGYSLGFGVSTITVGASLLKALVGLNFYF